MEVRVGRAAAGRGEGRDSQLKKTIIVCPQYYPTVGFYHDIDNLIALRRGIRVPRRLQCSSILPLAQNRMRFFFCFSRWKIACDFIPFLAAWGVRDCHQGADIYPYLLLAVTHDTSLATFPQKNESEVSKNKMIGAFRGEA